MIQRAPKVTFALFAYNQGDYVSEAVKGAFEQTYSPLEIILSDDGSTDKTADILQAMAYEYRGPHNIILNLNNTNHGLARHINKIMDMASGELVVLAAGDDISYPERTSALVDAWLNNNQPPALCSFFNLIDSSGRDLGDQTAWFQSFLPRNGELKDDILIRLVTTGSPALIGCTEAWRLDLFRLFSGLPEKVMFEDAAVSFRAWLVGDIVYLPDKLIAYRQHKNNISNVKPHALTKPNDVVNKEKLYSTWVARYIALLDGYLIDTEVATRLKLIDIKVSEMIINTMARQKSDLELRLAWWDLSLLQRWHYVIKLIANKEAHASLKWYLSRSLPLNVFSRLKIMLSYLSRR